jgi:phage-related protein
MRCLPLLIVVAACSSSPANVAGTYSVAVTNRDNGCNLMNWTVGNSAANIGVTITQNGTQAIATVNGLVGGYLDVVLGSHELSGTVDGDHLSLTLFGTRTSSSGNCTWTYNANLEADLNGDILQGTIDYRPKTNGNPDCTQMLATCSSRQDFNGTRPPT